MTLIRRAARGAWLAAALLVVTGSAARADSTWVDRYRAAQAAYRAGDLPGFRAGLLRVAAEIGETPGVNYNLACAEARLGDRAEALRRLGLFATSGLVSEPAADSDLVSLWSDPAFPKIAERIRQNGDSIGTAREIHRFRDAGLLTEDIAYDPKTRSFFATSVHRGRVIEVTSSGKEREWVDPEGKPGWGVFAACVDAPRRLLWTSVGAVPTTTGYDPADSGRTGLVAWDLRTRRPVQRVEWPRDGMAHLLGDVTVGPDGAVFACDSPAGAVRVLRPGAKTLATLVADGGFRGPQTPALAPDGRRLYVPDYGRGIAILDLTASGGQPSSTARWTWITFAPGLALQGIDGLYAVGHDLIAVQNGITPRRVVRIRLDPSGTRALAVEPIESGTHRLGEPTHGVIAGNGFVFLANTGWERVGRDQILQEGPAAAPALLRVPLK
jgi:sugar lactone lactonase YvrE